LWSVVKTKIGYPESPSEVEMVRALDTRLRGQDGRVLTFCHTREGGYPELWDNSTFVIQYSTRLSSSQAAVRCLEIEAGSLIIKDYAILA
jgi:hypothetical protein